jgi:hypothetical protein
VINPAMLEGIAAAVTGVQPLGGGELIEVDTTHPYDLDELVARVRATVS